VVIASYNDHCSAPFSRAFLVGLAPPKFTRAWEPTLSWNQLRSLRISGKCFPRRESCEATPGERLSKSEHHLVITILT
jgi:hypothetical protein